MPKTLNLDEASSFLNQYKRTSLSDGTFGGTDIGWTDENNKLVAGGWFEGNVAEVSADITHPLGQEVSFRFEGDDARSLRFCGRIAEFIRNDPGEETDMALVRSDPGILRDPTFVPNVLPLDELITFNEMLDRTGFRSSQIID